MAAMTYDKARLCLFDTLAVALRGSLVRGYSETELMEPAPRNKALFEAWLSNLIEGLGLFYSFDYALGAICTR